MTKLSIITVTYNNDSGLEKTIQSVLSQTVQDFEYIVVDGDSNDNSKSIVRLHSDVIDVFISEKDKGIYDAMNKGVNVAKGEYCLFLNAGDCFYDSYVIENVLPSLGGIDILYGDSFKIKPHYRRIIKYKKELTLLDFYKVIPPLHHQASFIKRELFEKYGLYNIEIPVFADWEFFFRTIILNRVSTQHLSFIVCSFDGTGLSNSISNQNPMRKELNDVRYAILSEHFPDYILNDYKHLDQILSKTSFFTKLMNKISYFNIRK